MSHEGSFNNVENFFSSLFGKEEIVNAFLRDYYNSKVLVLNRYISVLKFHNQLFNYIYLYIKEPLELLPKYNNS